MEEKYDLLYITDNKKWCLLKDYDEDNKTFCDPISIIKEGSLLLKGTPLKRLLNKNLLFGFRNAEPIAYSNYNLILLGKSSFNNSYFLLYEFFHELGHIFLHSSKNDNNFIEELICCALPYFFFEQIPNSADYIDSKKSHLSIDQMYPRILNNLQTYLKDPGKVYDIQTSANEFFYLQFNKKDFFNFLLKYHYVKLHTDKNKFLQTVLATFPNLFPSQIQLAILEHIETH